MTLVKCLLPAIGFSLAIVLAERDPFWPIGFDPNAVQPTPIPKDPGPAPRPTPVIVRQLTDEELEALAMEEARRISESFRRRATMQTGNRIFAYVEGENIVLTNKNPWLSQGDHFFIEIHGKRYRMDVVRLTKTRIQLEPHRITSDP